MPRSIQTTLTLWPWKDAASVAALVVVFALIFTTMDGTLSVDRVINPISFGVMTFFTFGGVAPLVHDDTGTGVTPAYTSAFRWAIQHPLRYALPAAACAGVILLLLRLAALATGAEGPWSGVVESTLDMTFRGAVVYLIISGTGLVIQRSAAFE